MRNAQLINTDLQQRRYTDNISFSLYGTMVAMNADVVFISYGFLRVLIDGLPCKLMFVVLVYHVQDIPGRSNQGEGTLSRVQHLSY